MVPKLPLNFPVVEGGHQCSNGNGGLSTNDKDSLLKVG